MEQTSFINEFRALMTFNKTREARITSGFQEYTNIRHFKLETQKESTNGQANQFRTFNVEASLERYNVFVRSYNKILFMMQGINSFRKMKFVSSKSAIFGDSVYTGNATTNGYQGKKNKIRKFVSMDDNMEPIVQFELIPKYDHNVFNAIICHFLRPNENWRLVALCIGKAILMMLLDPDFVQYGIPHSLSIPGGETLENTLVPRLTLQKLPTTNGKPTSHYFRLENPDTSEKLYIYEMVTFDDGKITTVMNDFISERIVLKTSNQDGVDSPCFILTGQNVKIGVINGMILLDYGKIPTTEIVLSENETGCVTFRSYVNENIADFAKVFVNDEDDASIIINLNNELLYPIRRALILAYLPYLMTFYMPNVFNNDSLRS